MPLVTRYRWRKDKDCGEYGWLDVNAPDHFNVCDGRLIAHDVLEHIGVRTDNTNEDEIMALGAAVFVRGLTGMLNNDYTGKGWKETIAKDLCQEFNNIANGDQKFKPPVTHKLYCDDTDDELKEAVEMAAKDYVREYEGKMPSRKIRKGVLSFLRIGYRRAEKRYKKSYWAADLFREIREEVDRLTKYTDEFSSELKITLNLKEMKVRIELNEIYEEYY